MRFLVVGLVAISFAACASACLIAYSDYDNRFQSDAAPSAFVTDDAGIVAITTTQTDLFYATGDVIKRVPLDGGAATTWWTEDASVSDLASDQSTTIAWTAKQVVRKADVGSPQSSTMIASGVSTFDKLAANTVGFAWFQGDQATCPCTLGGVELWDSATPAPLAFDDAATKIGPADVAIDNEGVTLFAPSIGLRRYAFDGGLSCTQGAGVRGNQGLLHAIASGASSTPFFSIGSPSGTLASYASTCTQENATAGPTAIAVIDDGANIFWLTNTSALCGPSLDASTCVDIPAGTVNAMTFDATSIYLAIGASIYRVSKP